MVERKSQDATAFYKDIMKSNGILAPVAEIIIEQSDTQGDGFLSERELITVTFEDGDLKPVHLFAKRSIPMSQDAKAFEKENIFLTKYVPAVKEFFQRKGIDESWVEDIYPKCYFGDDTIIVLEDIVREKGYEILGRDEVHNFEAAVASLQTLARHHAISHAMIQEEGGPDKFFQRFPYLDYESLGNMEWLSSFEPWMRSALKANFKILELNINVDGVPEAIRQLRELCERETTICGLVLPPLQKTEGQIQYLNHGDYWYCNMMFQKDPDSGKIIGHKALDFQIVHYNCPSLDILLYLFSSVKTEVRQNRLKELFESYLTILNKFSDDLGHPTELDYETLFLQYRKRMQYGLVCSFFFQYGPGLGILKDVDMTILDRDEQGATIEKLSTEWIEKNPDQAKSHAELLVKVLHEFCELEIK